MVAPETTRGCCSWIITQPRGCLNALARYSSSLPVSGLSRRPPTQIRIFLPKLLQSSDFIDAPDSATRSVPLGPDQSYTAIRYESKKNGSRPRLLFPQDSRGDSSLPPTAGEIRFRLAAHDNPAVFRQGTDLVGLRGLSWSIPLWRILNFAEALQFKKQVIKDELVDPRHIRAVEKVLSESASELKCTTIGSLSFPWMFSDTRGGSLMQLYTGRILVRFEHSTVPQHAGTRTLLLHILKILQPVEAIIPGYDIIYLDKSRSSYKDLNLFLTYVSSLRIYHMRLTLEQKLAMYFKLCERYLIQVWQ